MDREAGARADIVAEDVPPQLFERAASLGERPVPAGHDKLHDARRDELLGEQGSIMSALFVRSASIISALSLPADSLMAWRIGRALSFRFFV